MTTRTSPPSAAGSTASIQVVERDGLGLLDVARAAGCCSQNPALPPFFCWTVASQKWMHVLTAHNSLGGLEELLGVRRLRLPPFSEVSSGLASGPSSKWHLYLRRLSPGLRFFSTNSDSIGEAGVGAGEVGVFPSQVSSGGVVSGRWAPAGGVSSG